MSSSPAPTSLARRVATLAVTLLAVASLAACGSDDGDAATDPTVTAEIGDAATVTSSTAAAPEPEPSEPPATEPAAPVGAADPGEAAATLYAAWKAGDRTVAATVADPVAVDGVFAAAPGDYALYNRCDTGEFGSSSCLYRGDPGTIQFAMTERDGTWVVTNAIFSEA
jgi:hypothetical protein